MLTISGINSNKCIQCQKCILECPSHLFAISTDDNKIEERALNVIQFSDQYSLCIKCGHCLAICPVDAIEYESTSELSDFPSNWKNTKPNYEIIHTFLRSKRSIRHFSSEPLTKEEISAVLNSMRYSPSASNARSWKFIVLTDPQLIKKLSTKVVKSINFTKKILKNWIVRKLFLFGNTRKIVNEPGFFVSINRVLEDAKNGKDPIFFDAPCVIIIYSPKYGNLAGCDSGIITTYGMLAAEALGIGSCWIGIAQEVMMRLPSIRKLIGIPRGYLPWGCFVLGKSFHQFKKLPPRDPLSVQWREKENE
ncbi:nitroreductase family protein [Candidatus Harpocratesius sp.]